MGTKLLLSLPRRMPLSRSIAKPCFIQVLFRCCLFMEPVEGALASPSLTFKKDFFTQHFYAAILLTAVVNPVDHIVRELSMIRL